MTAPRWATVRAAVVVAGVLRVVWAVLMTRSPQVWYEGWNLRIADQFAHGHTPSFGGVHTAYWPPGYGMILTPFAWVSDHTGWFGMAGAASALNVVFGTASVALVGALAARWFTPTVAVAAAWLFAVAPGHIYATTGMVAEPVTTTLFLGAVLWATRIVDAGDRPRARMLLGLGVLVGLTVLVRDVGGILLVAPALALRARRGSFRGALRATGLTVAGALVLLLPWGVRNAVQVDWYSPMSTITAEGVCATKYDLDQVQYFAGGGGPEVLGREMVNDCYRGSLFDTNVEFIGYKVTPDIMVVKGPHEGEWARRNNSKFLSWAIRHPQKLARNVPMRIYGALGSDRNGGLEIAGHFGDTELAGPFGLSVYDGLANLWYHLVLVLAAVGLLRSRAARRAIPIWTVVAVYATYTWLAPWSLSRHIYPSYAFMAILAAVAVASIRPTGRTTIEAPVESPAGDAS